MSPNKPDLMSSIPAPTETPQPPWLMSFADFVSCLLACFVMLYSLVAIDRSKFDQLMEGMPGRQVVEDIPGSAERAMAIVPEDEGRNADYLTSVIKAKLEQDPDLANIEVVSEGDRVILNLPPKDLLSVGSGGEAAGQALVHAIGGALGTVPNKIAVEVRPDRPAEFTTGLAYAVRLAARLEQAGANGPIAARTRLTAPGEAAGIDLIVFDSAPPAPTP